MSETAELLNKFDKLLEDNGPAAIVLTQWLRPVGDAVIFPPSYANPSQRKGDPPVYNIDRFGETSTIGKKFERYKKSHIFVDVDRIEHGRQHSVCVIDSIPSQANRIEPALGRVVDQKGEAVKLVPRASVNATIDKEPIEIDLLDVGHRGSDVLVRMSSKGSDLKHASTSRLRGDSVPLAKVAPTSLVFGMWDSRDTGVKIPRLLNSVIRAYDVLEYRRSSQFNPAIDFQKAGITRGSKDKELSEVGMDSAPSVFQPGGVEATGGIRRDAAINLCTLRDISAKSKVSVELENGCLKYEKLETKKEQIEETRKLQRYILGLALVAITYFDGKTLNLRQGCQLVNAADKPSGRVLVSFDGIEEPLSLERNQAIDYAAATAKAFGVGPDWGEVTFDVGMAKAALKKSKKETEAEQT